MKKLLFATLMLFAFQISYSQTDTISSEIYGVNGYLGIGTTTPENRIHIVDHNPRVVVESEEGHFMRIGAGTQGAAITFDKDGYLSIEPRDNATTGSEGGNGIVVDGDANVGIGTLTPKAKLEIADGDIYIKDINNGIIMTSPDGKCWRGTMSNSGTLDFSAITCPGESDSTETLSANADTLSTNSMKVENSDIKIYPNPTNDRIVVDMSELNIEKCNVDLYNLKGENLLSNTLASTESSIDISDLTVGTYVLHIKDENNNILYSNTILKY